MLETVFVLKRNADTTEGRGPMVLHSVWGVEVEAKRFMDKQPGVMGRRAKWSSGPLASGGDWTIEEFPVLMSELDYTNAQLQETRIRALAKLSAEEKVALGIHPSIESAVRANLAREFGQLGHR